VPAYAEARPRRHVREAMEDVSAVVGFADHVPAFLLRPVKVPRETEAIEEV
jgi:hypothetical protein